MSVAFGFAAGVAVTWAVGYDLVRRAREDLHYTRQHVDRAWEAVDRERRWRRLYYNARGRLS